MKKGIGKAIQKRTVRPLEDIDFYDFAEMLQRGLQDEELEKELGINKKYIQEYKNKLYNEFDIRW